VCVRDLTYKAELPPPRNANRDSANGGWRSFVMVNPIAFKIVRHPKRAIKWEGFPKQWPQTNTQARNAHDLSDGVLGASAAIGINIE